MIHVLIPLLKKSNSSVNTIWVVHVFNLSFRTQCLCIRLDVNLPEKLRDTSMVVNIAPYTWERDRNMNRAPSGIQMKCFQLMTFKRDISRPWVFFLRWTSSGTRLFPVCASWTPQWNVAAGNRGIGLLIHIIEIHIIEIHWLFKSIWK